MNPGTVSAPSSSEELLTQLSELAKSGPEGNRFKVKIEYKDRLATLPVLILGINDMRLNELLDPETWLFALLGGAGQEGQFVLSVYHAAFKELSVPVGRINVKGGGNPHWKPNTREFQINWEVTDLPDWQGPLAANIYHPKRPVPKKDNGETLLNFARGEERTETAVPPRRFSNDLPAGGSSQFPNEAERLAKKAQDLEERERKVEVEAVRREADLRVKQLEVRIDDLSRREREKPLALAPIAPAAPSILTPEVLMATINGAIQLAIARAEASARIAESSAKLQAEATIRAAEISARAAESAAKAGSDQFAILREIASKGDKAGETYARMMEGMSKVQVQSADMSATMISAMTKLMMEVAESMRPADDKDSELVKVLKVAFGALGKMGGPMPGVPQLTGATDGQPGQPGPQGEELPDLPKSVEPVEQMVFAMEDPAKVAAEIVRLAEVDKPFIALVTQYQNNVQALFDDYFGEWVDEDKEGKRSAYAAKLFEAVAARVQARVAEKTAAEKK